LNTAATGASGNATYAPIAIFAYRRLDHLRRTIEALAANAEATASDVLVFSDGARDQAAEEDVAAVRQFLRTVDGFGSLRVIERPANIGLARSIVSGVSEVLRARDRVIVVEDDLVTSPHFLRYMNDALAKYQHDERVVSVHAYVYPVRRSLPETFFLRGADCWGWATWRRGWQVFSPDGPALLAGLLENNLTDEFDFRGAFDYTGMLRDQIAGRNDSWAVRWYASAFLAGKLTLYPGRSLVQNIGNDASGVHSKSTSVYDVVPARTPVAVDDVAVTDSAEARRAFIEFGRSNRARPSVAARLVSRVKRWVRP
jgi:hypothetical protein